MAPKNILIAFLLFLSLPLLPACCIAANYRSHSFLSLHNKSKHNMGDFLLTKGAPIPPSGPSGRGNVNHSKHGAPEGSAKDGDKA
ncbi:hypothetical protein AB3S75_037862 [Citrus x aurantiifolia]